MYEIDESVLAEVDRLEGHPELYTRTPTHCHIITPSPHSHTSSLVQSSPVTVECQTYLFYDHTDEVLTKPHLDSYDCDKLPEGMKYIRRDQRTREHVTAVHESFRRIKKNIHKS